ncbi:4-hydroxy-tetrahydrodipicolinate reductase [Pseudoalteromonas sp. T1lg65]|uniref:4-hydroxy-tetrahydrodipicolinate reductase n=1 Tax=Pseudoalteromonas sp. T1lg65 TaxID=2077101 RepID=UPI003F79B44A
MTRVGIYGANGRMGLALIEACAQAKGAELEQACVRSTSALLDQPVKLVQPVANSDISFSSESLPRDSVDVWIDFTLPEGMQAHLAKAIEQKKAMVIGTTGLNAEEMQRLYEAAKHIPIVFSRNYSVGINLLLNLVQVAATKLADEMDIEIFESHHRNKIDAPSGTALAIGEAIASAKGWQHDDVAVYDRSQHHHAKSQNEIGYSVLRAGDIVGEHTAYFATMGERLELTHRSASRLTFAAGAVRAAEWLKDKPEGFYDMQDVLNLK